MKRITEDDLEHLEWYKEAKNVTQETLPEFLRHLTEDYEHDYGTICHACAAVAVAGAYAVNHSPQGGVTGFQAGAIMWEFIRNWNNYGDHPMRLLDYEKMLYPQYAHDFNKISKRTWDWLRGEADKKMKEDSDKAHIAVVAHWKKIKDGEVPFGFEVETND